MGLNLLQPLRKSLESKDFLIKRAFGGLEMPKKPDWLKVKAPVSSHYFHLKSMFKQFNLATVCQEAMCPNIGECWQAGTATIMLMGEVCTRGCRFCHVKTGNPRGAMDQNEPEKVGQAIAQMGLDYVVLTSVDRDDLPDGGANHFARTVEVIKQQDSNLLVEVLTPDFQAQLRPLQRVVEAEPDVFAHNVETVERLTPAVRDSKAGYCQSLFVLEKVKQLDDSRYTKTSLMLGLGERDREVYQTLKHLRDVGCDVVTFGQYLQPTKRHLPVKEYVTPDAFKEWQVISEEMGFLYVASGPLVRSSYRAGEYFMKGVIKKTGKESKDGFARRQAT